MIPRYRGNLALLWLGWTALLVVYLVWRIIQQDGAVAATVGWLSPHLAPTLSLVGGVALMTKPEEAANQDPALKAAYLRALVASILYLLVVTAATFMVALTLGDAKNTLAPFGSVLGLLQGATAATLGVFFARTPTKG